MEIWNTKSGDNMYSDFEVKFGVVPKVHFRQAIYRFESMEVKNPTFQIVYKSELKQINYDYLKITV